MQALTPELQAILKSKFQAGASGFKARFEIDQVPDPVTGDGAFVQAKHGVFSSGPTTVTYDNPVTEGNTQVVILTERGSHSITGPAGFTFLANFKEGPPDGDLTTVWWRVAPVGASSTVTVVGPVNERRLVVMEFTGSLSISDYVLLSGQAVSENYPIGPVTIGGPGVLVGCVTADDTGGGRHTVMIEDPDFTTMSNGTCASDPPYAHPVTIASYREVTAGSYLYNPTSTQAPPFLTFGVQWGGILIAFEAAQPPIVTVSIQPESIGIDKSLRMTADQAEVKFANESLPLGWGPSSLFVTNSRCRIFQWYGDEASAVQTFTGLLDDHRDHRDFEEVSVAIRDMMAILIDQTFSTTAPQAADEKGAVRTEDNGVYLNREVSYIVDDILTRAGWPSADREVTETSYVLDEFVVNDGASWAETIIGDEQLSGLVGYSAWADELGVFHFAPTFISDNLTEPTEPEYTFRSGEDIVALDDATDQYDLRTRVKVRGPLTTQVLQDTWRELWRTSKFHRPVGIWFDPATPTYIRVIDRGTKRMYKLRQSDRAVLSSVNLGAVISYPLGLSGDPADATVYWVLNAPWIYTGSDTGNSVKKVRKSDNHVLATYSIPDGRWSALKVSSSFLWLTNLDTDRLHKKSKVDGSALASTQHVYKGVSQTNPSGVMVDGTTLYVFWSNGGTTARFLVCDESDITTITDVVKTAGTVLHGGEMDTVTHTECWGDSDSLGLVAKFTLVAKVDQTDEVYAEVVDSELEDDLGALAQLEDRIHDTHTGDAAHPYEVRRMTLDLSVITSLAQATETAQRQLDIASVRRRVLDVGIVGNPALQKTDPVVVVDDVTGLEDLWVIDTYRTDMAADGTYLGTLALLPVGAFDDDPTDDGDAT